MARIDPDPEPDSNVVRLSDGKPVRLADGSLEPVGEVLEGEIVTPEQWDTIQQRRRESRREDIRKAAVVTVQVTRTVATHDRTKAVGRTVRRHATIVAKGVEAERQRKKAEKNQTDVRAARARALQAGDLDKVAELNRQIHDARHLRVDTLHKWVELNWSVAKKVALVLIIALGVALVAGVINGAGHWLGPWNVLDVLNMLGAILTTTGTVVGWSVVHWWLWLLAGLGVWSFRRWKDGARLGEQVLPETLRKTGKRTAYIELTENALVTALANIGNAKLTAAAKDGWPNRDTDNAWVQGPAIDGKGYGAKLRLPQGASVAAVNRSKELLAHNLGCRLQELFIEADDTDPTVMDLFRLEPGILREPVPPYPLLKNLSEAITDFWTGFPVGINPRGIQVICEVLERNFVIAGIMGSGKTTLVLLLLAGAVLDPLVDIDVFCFAENYDYDPLLPCLNMLVKGDTAGNVAACMEHIENLQADLTVRGKLLAKLGIRSVAEATREQIAQEPGLRPRIVVIDECQAFYRQDKPEDRRAVVNQIVRFKSAARKYGIILVFVTPIPSDQSLPRDVVAAATNRACGAIGDKHRNNVVLGEKAHENGISALGLKPKTKGALNDAGTLITIGFMDTPGPLRTHYLTPDELAMIAARGVELRHGAIAQTAEAEADVLADVLAVMEDASTDEPGRAGEVVKAMAARWPRRYQGWKIATLVQALDKEHVRVPTTNRAFPIDPDTVRYAMVQRDAGGGEDE